MAMDYKMLIIFPLFFSVVWGGRGAPSQEITYDGSKDLSSGINVMWKVEEKSIVLKLKYRATGWVGIGFSKSKHPQSMADSDITIGWVTMGKASVWDAYAKTNGVPDVDKKSEVELISGKEESGFTTIVFRRPIIAMNDDDVTIHKGEIGILWAYGRSDVTGGTLSVVDYHARRGYTTLTLIPTEEIASEPSLPDPAKPESPKDVEDHDDADDDDDKQAHEHDDKDLNHFIYLDADKKLFLRWGVKGQEITFKLKGETLGWMGIGLSPGHGMTNSDLMIVGVNREGKAYAYDCFAPENTTPSVDKTQNVEIIEYDQTDTHTTVTFKRALVTDDESGNDRSIQTKNARYKQNADTYFLWAYGLYDVLGAPGIVNYHFGRRGYLKLNLLHGVGEAMKPAESPKSPEGVEMEESEVPEGFISVKGYKKLDEAGDVVLQWSTAYTSEAVIFIQLSAPTTGWVGLGFSPGNTMKDADLIVAGIKDGTPYIFDLHATRNTLPLVDANQDVLLFQAVEDGPRAIVMMLKKYKSGDTENDIDIMAGKMNVLWAYGETDVDEKLTRMNYHGRNRGHVEVEFIPSDTSAIADIEDHDDHDDDHDDDDDDDDDKQAHEHDDKELKHFIYLDADEKLFLRWGVKGQEITFKLKGETMGWMGIGLSSGPGMTNSDLMIVGVNREGKAYAYDCFAPENTTPSVDKTQNVEIIEYDQTDTHTTVTFKRALVTNDESGEDRSIQNADTYFIWAYGLYDVVGAPGTINYHFRRRGYLKLNLLHGMGEMKPVESPKSPEGVETGTPELPEGFMYVRGYQKLDEAGEVVLQWGSAYYSEALMYIQISAPTTGWVGFGLSPGDSMKDSDLAVAGIKDGTSYIFDLYATKNTLPMVDAKQDITLIQAVEDGPRTIVMLLKKYKSEDTENDINIVVGKMNVLWAYGQTDVDGTLTGMNYHGRNRGHAEVEFIPSDPSLIPMDGHSPGSPKSPKLGTGTDSPDSIKSPKTLGVTGMSPPSQSGPGIAKSPISPDSPDTGTSHTPVGPNNIRSPMSPNTGKSPQSPESSKKPPQISRPVRRKRIFQGGATDIDKLFDDDKMYKQAVLNEAHKVNLKWAYNKDYIVFQISILTNGWIGVGFSPGPNMAKADIVISGVRRDGVYALDAYASRNGKPQIDLSQDIKVLRYVETEGVTTVTFARKLDTTDSMDNKIGDSKYVIWAYGRADFAKKPRNFYHGSNRGSKMLTLIDGSGGLAADFEMNSLVLVPGKLK
ncbi:uncharacterized protein LOC120337231 isoform X2 [Styela clava]